MTQNEQHQKKKFEVPGRDQLIQQIKELDQEIQHVTLNLIKCDFNATEKDIEKTFPDFKFVKVKNYNPGSFQVVFQMKIDAINFIRNHYDKKILNRRFFIKMGRQQKQNIQDWTGVGFVPRQFKGPHKPHHKKQGQHKNEKHQKRQQKKQEKTQDEKPKQSNTQSAQQVKTQTKPAQTQPKKQGKHIPKNDNYHKKPQGQRKFNKPAQNQGQKKVQGQNNKNVQAKKNIQKKEQGQNKKDDGRKQVKKDEKPAKKQEAKKPEPVTEKKEQDDGWIVVPNKTNKKR